MSWAIGPTGLRLTLEDLPDPGDRWTAFRKATIVAALNGRLIGINDVLQRYDLTVGELATWQRSFEHFGMPGLRQTKALQVRDRIIRDTHY